MKSLQLYSFQSSRIISWGDDVVASLIEALERENFELEDRDIVSVTSKVISMEEKARIRINNVVASEQAITLSETAKMDPRVIQMVLDESEGKVYGAVYRSILAHTKYGLSANAGIDLSNVPTGYALLLPRDPDASARRIRNKILERKGVDVAVIITDSRTLPMKKGAAAVTIGVAGMDPIVDERGKEDLYGVKMSITTRALADNAATATNLIMGESNERTPFAVIRGLPYLQAEKASMLDTMLPDYECLYYGPLLKLIGEKPFSYDETDV